MAPVPATQARDGKSHRPIRADRGGSGGPFDRKLARRRCVYSRPSSAPPRPIAGSSAWDGRDRPRPSCTSAIWRSGSLTVGLIAALFSAVIGTIIGICAGYYGGRLDSFLMRITDSVIALPLLPLLIVLAAVDLTKLGFPEELADSEDMSLYRIVFIVSLVGWTTVARLVRAETLSMRKREFVRAAMALGADTNRILLTHILPNVVSPIVVATTLSVGNIILFESVLSFLGLGIQPPVASWGNMLSNAQDLVWSSPELATWPGLFIFVTVIAFNFLGDGLQDALDPRAGD